MSSLIHDGYTLEATIAPVGPWAALLIRYRPALAENVLEFIHQRDQVRGKEQIKPLMDFLTSHLIGWDARDAKGEILPVMAKNLRGVPYPQLTQVLDHIMGYAEAQQADDAKNSATASG